MPVVRPTGPPGTNYVVGLTIHKFVFRDMTPASAPPLGSLKCVWRWCQDAASMFTESSTDLAPPIPQTQLGEPLSIVEWNCTPSKHITLAESALKTLEQRVLLFQVIASSPPKEEPQPSLAFASGSGFLGEKHVSMMSSIFTGSQNSGGGSPRGGGGAAASSPHHHHHHSGHNANNNGTVVASGTVDLAMFVGKPPRDYAIRLENNFVAVGKLYVTMHCNIFDEQNEASAYFNMIKKVQRLTALVSMVEVAGIANANASTTPDAHHPPTAAARSYTSSSVGTSSKLGSASQQHSRDTAVLAASHPLVDDGEGEEDEEMMDYRANYSTQWKNQAAVAERVKRFRDAHRMSK